MVIYYRGFTYFLIQYPVLKYGDILQRLMYFSVQYPVLKYGDILQRLYVLFSTVSGTKIW